MHREALDRSSFLPFDARSDLGHARGGPVEENPDRRRRARGPPSGEPARRPRPDTRGKSQPPLSGGEVISLSGSTQTPSPTSAPHRLPMDSDLRRADWRFLLPRPVRPAFQHLVLLGGSPSLSVRMARLGIADRVSSDPAETGSADVVGLLGGAPVELTEALRCLAPGGTLYWEVARRWTSLFRTMPGAIRRRLAAAGLETASIHYARPNFHQAAIYMPVGARGVLSWYIATHFLSRGLASRTARTVLRLLAWTGDWWLHLAPRYVVTATAGQRHRSASGLATSVPLGGIGTEPALAVLMLGGADPSRRVIVFAFSPGARQPSTVVKTWRLPDR